MERTELLNLIAKAKAENWTELDLSSKNLTEIPPEIAQLSSLIRLDLSKNQISVIPPEIAQLSSLQTLYLDNNQISVIPPEIAQLSSLEVLFLSNNQISIIPPEIAQLSSLRNLYLSNNQISVIPPEIAQLSSLQTLNLYRNQISVIPPEIAQLSSLQRLDLSNNQISVIPPEIAQLSSLQDLSLSDNKISIIPPEIAQLSSLKILYLSNNQISVIPPEIAQLSSLQILDLSVNKISIIPQSMIQLTKLERLVLDYNPITHIPPEIISQGDRNPQAIFSYLQENDKRPLNEIKVLLVGEGDVGKTSLFKQLKEGIFNPEECKTPGINIEPWYLPEKPHIRLNLWDFGGQKVMHNTHQFFFTKRSLYLLVVDNRKNEQQNRIEYWLKLIETYGGDSPIIIIGNCADEHSPQVKIRYLKKKYPQIVIPEKQHPFEEEKVIATSCKTGQGIEELRKEIACQLNSDTIPHIFDPFPITWFAMKTQLEKMQKQYDFISYEKYQDYCCEKEITNTKDQETLVKFLHDLGIVLNYQDDPRLKETNVLNPEWVTSGVYDILNNYGLMVQDKGVLLLTKLPQILKQPSRYPEQKRPFLMGLMEKFELCFPLDDYPHSRYLITDLLPIDEPDVDVYETATLHFQYRYDILPSSIISRFIVRNHTMIYKSMRWRSGVVLYEGNSKALVRSDEEDNFISIKLQGSHPGHLLAIIRNDFTKIHNTIPHLAVQEYLVVKEVNKEGEITGREIPVNYIHLCDLEKDGQTEVILPDLQGKYNPHDLLAGVESYEARASNLEERRDKAKLSRIGRPLEPFPYKTPNLLKPSLSLLFILAVISCIIAVLAHSIPVLQFTITLIAVILVFSLIIITVLLITGILDKDTFNQSLITILQAIPLLKGQTPSNQTETQEIEGIAESGMKKEE